jgi:hypothetical protein
MVERGHGWCWVIALVAAVAAGLLVAGFDVAAPFGHDTAPVTVFLWLLLGGSFGFLLPRRPWRWALLIGPWLSVVYGVRQALGLANPIHPDTDTTTLVLVPVSLAVCLLAACGGSLLRAATRPG